MPPSLVNFHNLFYLLERINWCIYFYKDSAKVGGKFRYFIAAECKNCGKQIFNADLNKIHWTNLVIYQKYLIFKLKA